jgi:cold shock CspA family protein
MQGTVKTFDATTRSGAVFLDDGTELTFDAQAFDAGGLRHLRLGQRVRLRTTESSGTGRVRVTVITLVTFDLPPLPVPPWERDEGGQARRT